MPESVDGAHVAVHTSLGLKKGERLMILVDEPRIGMGGRFLSAALDAKADAFMVTIPEVGRDGQEPPHPVARLMREMHAIIIATEGSMSHTLARKQATKAGARIITMPGITDEMLGEGGMTADFRKVHMEARRLFRIFKGSKVVMVKTDAGTNLTMSIKGRSWIAEDTGICHRRGDFTNLPAGELFVSPVAGSAEGEIVVDGSFRGLVKEGIVVRVESGYAVRIKGAREAVHELNKGGREGRLISKFGIGLNPKARVIGREIEDAKVLGCVSIGFGDNSRFGGQIRCPTYLECVIRSAAVALDNQVILRDGKLLV
ncbi:MAG: aminopeptidase [Candidatus Thermoplasmatota archaeon]